jgi:hypothetical protein
MTPIRRHKHKCTRLPRQVSISPFLLSFSPINHHIPSIRKLAERKESVGHWLEVPNSAAFRAEGSVPFIGQFRRDRPAELIVSNPHAHQVPPLLQRLAVDETLSTMQDKKVVDEVHVSGLRGDFELGCLSNDFYGIESFHLTGRELGEVGRARIARAS